MISLSKIEKHTDEFRQWLESRSYSPRTRQTYYLSVKGFLTANPWGDEYQYSDIVTYFEGLTRSHLSIATRKDILIHLKRYYDFLVHTKKRKDHPCAGFFLKGAKDQGVIQSDLFAMEELEQLMNRQEGWGKQPLRNRLIFSLYIYQALTSEEIYKLMLADVDLDKGYIKVRGGRRRNSRILEIKPSQYGLIHDYLREERKVLAKKGSPPVFILNQYGNASSHDSVCDTLLPVKEWFPGRQLNALTIRQSVFSYWLNVLKVPIEDVQLLTGIRWVSSLERYQHITESEEQEMMKKFHPLG